MKTRLHRFRLSKRERAEVAETFAAIMAEPLPLVDGGWSRLLLDAAGLKLELAPPSLMPPPEWWPEAIPSPEIAAWALRRRG